MGKVVKRDGRRVAFNAAKLRRSVASAAKEAGLSSSRIKELLEEVAEPVIKSYKNRTVKATKLRTLLLGRLDRKSKKVAKAWRVYDRKKKK